MFSEMLLRLARRHLVDRSQKDSGFHIAVKNVDWGLPVCGPKAPPSDGDARGSVIWRVKRPWGLLGPEIAQVEGRPSWPSGVPAEAASGRAAHHARTQQAHHACIGSSG